MGTQTVFVLLIVSVAFVTAVLPTKDASICHRITQSCHSQYCGSIDVMMTALNSKCATLLGTQWKDISGCEAVRIACEYSLLHCRPLTCANIARTMCENS